MIWYLLLIESLALFYYIGEIRIFFGRVVNVKKKINAFRVWSEDIR